MCVIGWFLCVDFETTLNGHNPCPDWPNRPNPHYRHEPPTCGKNKTGPRLWLVPVKARWHAFGVKGPGSSTPFKLFKCVKHTGAKTNILSRNYQEFYVWKMWILWKMIFSKSEFCEKWEFENVDFVKNEIFQRWILWKIIFSKSEFCEKWYFQNGNFWINWGFLLQCVILSGMPVWRNQSKSNKSGKIKPRIWRFKMIFSTFAYFQCFDKIFLLWFNFSDISHKIKFVYS